MSSKNLFVLPVAEFDASVISLLADFKMSAQHVAKSEELNIFQASDFLQDTLIGIEPQSYYGLIITDILLSLSEKIYNFESLDGEEHEDGYLEYHNEAFEIVEKVLPYTLFEGETGELQAKDRAIYLLLRYGYNTSDYVLSTKCINLALNSVEGDYRSNLLGDVLYHQCLVARDNDPLFALEFLGGAIDALAEGSDSSLGAISLWQDCSRRVDPEDIIELLLFERESTSNDSFASVLRDQIAEYNAKPKPPVLTVI